MTVRVGIVTNPLDPSSWQEHETDDVRALLAATFPQWPASARIYDLSGIGDWTRAASLIDANALAQRDVTPRDPAGVERLGSLPGPLLVTIPPADPITAIIAVVAVGLAIGASLLLMPKINLGNQRSSSPNNQLSERSNQARPNARIPDIFGTVRSIPDMLTVPYRKFVGDLEVEYAFMCVGRGAYALADVRDGETALEAIAGAGAQFYGPGTSPNSGAAQLTIGTAITEPIFSVVAMNEVTGQVLKPQNFNRYRGENSVRFTQPDLIERLAGDDEDFSDLFEDGDELLVGNAGFGGQAYFDLATESARFYADGTIEFQTFDPSTLFIAGQQLTISNAVFTHDPGTGPITIDLSGTYTIDSVSSTQIVVIL